MQQKWLWLTRLATSTWSQAEHVCDEYAAGTNTTRLPYLAALYVSWRSSSYKPTPSKARFNPDFCATLVPGSCWVPRAEAVMFFNFRFSSTMTLWFLA